MWSIRVNPFVLIIFGVFLAATQSFDCRGISEAAEWKIPLAGNAYRVHPEPGGNGFRRGDGLTWQGEGEVYAVYFHVDRSTTLELAVEAAGKSQQLTIAASIGEVKLLKQVTSADDSPVRLGTVPISEPGYVKVELQLSGWGTTDRPKLNYLVARSQDENVTLHYVKTNEGNMYYWGRRGPSVHLSYQVPRAASLKYAYNELVIPEGYDPIGSYFMAIGFSEGYFGIQVNSESERRVLFSVWSPYQTDDPKSIPADQRIVNLAKGGDVTVGEFGNEGSGGQSYRIYPWKAGTKYRFLLEVEPSEADTTTYTAWMSEAAANQWDLIASFRRPKTSTTLKGFHSFLENFDPAYGHVERRVFYENIWVADAEGTWQQCDQARFSVDATGGGRHRLDFTGGSEGTRFFLQNCGFFDESERPGTVFKRDLNQEPEPVIEFDALPRG